MAREMVFFFFIILAKVVSFLPKITWPVSILLRFGLAPRMASVFSSFDISMF